MLFSTIPKSSVKVSDTSSLGLLKCGGPYWWSMRTAPQEAEDWLDWGAGVERGSPVFNKDSASVGGLQKNQIESVCVHACVHTCVCVLRDLFWGIGSCVCGSLESKIYRTSQQTEFSPAGARAGVYGRFTSPSRTLSFALRIARPWNCLDGLTVHQLLQTLATSTNTFPAAPRVMLD
jgi:hypothetical protein